MRQFLFITAFLLSPLTSSEEVYLDCDYEYTMNDTYELSKGPYKEKSKFKQKNLFFLLDLNTKRVKDKFEYETNFEESGNIITFFKTYENQSYYWIFEINRINGKTLINQFQPIESESYDFHHWRDNEWSIDIFGERNYRKAEVDHYTCKKKTKLF